MKSQAQGRSRLHRLIAVSGCVVLVGAASVACAAKVDEKAPQDEVATKQVTRQEKRYRGPVGHMIETVRKHGNLDAAQAETLDTIERELEANRESRHALHQKLKSSAIAVVRAGSTDSPEFEQSVREATSAIEESVQQGVDALVEIHAILKPEQRAAVAVALRERIEERHGQSRATHGKKRQREGFRRFASYLVLSKLQLDKLETIKKELLGEKQQLHPTREELHALVDAFEGEDFATALEAFRAEKALILRARVATAGKRTDSVLSIFTRPQRELLADLILEGPHKVLFGEEQPQIQAR